MEVAVEEALKDLIPKLLELLVHRDFQGNSII
jgi:hypothetical protein